VVANCDHLRRLKSSPTMPFAFTEHGALQAPGDTCGIRARKTGTAQRAARRSGGVCASSRHRPLRNAYDAV
jgi:hypothetical protein